MKDHVSLQERLKDLRVEKGLKLEELAEKTGISKSALASYENEENRNKEINHGNLITLADFYEVSIDYLFCRTENREQINTPLSELHLTDEAVALLKSGRINTRLLCEMMSHEKFAELMADAEIYVDGKLPTHKDNISNYRSSSIEKATDSELFRVSGFSLKTRLHSGTIYVYKRNFS